MKRSPARWVPRTVAEISPEGGTTVADSAGITVTGADAVTILVSIATNFNDYKDISGDPVSRAEAYLTQAKRSLYKRLRADHIAAYRPWIEQVSLDLGVNAQAAKTTDARVREFATHFDPQLVSLYFQFGRYLLICSSQPGGQAATLQGIWNHQTFPAWDSKYTININTEMNYWPAEATNLSELHGPLIDLIRDLRRYRASGGFRNSTAPGVGRPITIRISGASAEWSIPRSAGCGLRRTPGSASICGIVTCSAAIRSTWRRYIPL